MLGRCSDLQQHSQQKEAVGVDQSLLPNSPCQGQSRDPRTLLRLELPGFAATQSINHQNTKAQACPHRGVTPGEVSPSRGRWQLFSPRKGRSKEGLRGESPHRGLSAVPPDGKRVQPCIPTPATCAVLPCGICPAESPIPPSLLSAAELWGETRAEKHQRSERPQERQGAAFIYCKHREWGKMKLSCPRKYFN